MYTHVDVHGSEYVYVHAHMRARIGGAVATSAAPHRAPTKRVAVARRRPKAAHTEGNVVTDAVFHAPMFALNAFVE